MPRFFVFVVALKAPRKVRVRYFDPRSGRLLDKAADEKGLSPVALRPDVMQPLQQVVSEMWHVPVVPSMNTGASDAIYTDAAGMPTYGITGIGIDIGDVRAHGKDERVRAQSFYEGLDFYYRFLKAVTGVTAAR